MNSIFFFLVLTCVFVLVQQLGLDKAIEEIKFRMSRYNITPNMRAPLAVQTAVAQPDLHSNTNMCELVFAAVIIPPQLGLYMSIAPEAKLTYPLGGPAAQTAFEQGLQGFEARAFRGLGVFTSTPVRASFTDMPSCPLHVSFVLCVLFAVRGLGW